ncbi:MAG TPA: C40 family peptidase [Pyrinomonadaceae bacterium]|jgi:cell wall-associated NlpC family hydrolase|nr:C40 family peptidase [Pyrinomonadaceae bacterium]
MVLKKMFSRMLVACFVVSLLAAATQAQTATLQTQATTTTIQNDGAPRLESDPVIISLAEVEAPKTATGAIRVPHAGVTFDQLLTAAIDTRLGAPYVYGSSGPTVFDCSGFVWSAFQSIGIRFDRGSARTFWARFAPARGEERYKFGTLVFFNGLTHVGIVADEHGFYHASRSHGVAYAPFNDYWVSRIDGFRRVPMPTQMVAE